MLLRSDDYVFWAHKSTVTWDAYTETKIRIGNPNGRPKPCMTLTIDGSEAVLQDLVYYSTCSSPKQLEKGAGTVQMVKSALVAVMQTYPDVFKIMLQDESVLPDARRGNIPLPEYYMLVHGQTWYQKHFGAIPGDHRSVREYRMYRSARMAPVSALGEEGPGTVADFVKGIVNPTEEVLEDIRNRLELNMLSGTVWEIPRSTVLQYGVRGEFEDADVQSGGSEWPWKRTQGRRNRHLH